MSSLAEQNWLLGANAGSVKDFFAELGVVLVDRGSENVDVSCFANPEGHSRGDRRPSCSVSLITGLWCCQGCGASGNVFQAAQAMGWQDRQAADLAKRYGLFKEVEKREKPKLPYEPQLKKWRRAMRENPGVIARLGVVKGWSPEAIKRLGLGWDGERIIFVSRVVVRGEPKVSGVVRYLPGGDPKMLAFPGSKRGLFPAPEIIGRHHPLFVVEGEPDAVSVWSLGLRGVGIPGAGSWRSEWAVRLAGRRVIMLADCDPQGRKLAERVAADVPNCRWVDLEPGRDDGYDMSDIVCETAREGGVWQARQVLEGLAA